MKTWQYVKKGKMPKPRTTVIAAVRVKESSWGMGEYFKDEIIEAFYDDCWYTRSVCMGARYVDNRLAKLICDERKGALLLFPLLFLKSFLKKLKQLTKASSDGFSFNDHDESWRA